MSCSTCNPHSVAMIGSLLWALLRWLLQSQWLILLNTFPIRFATETIIFYHYPHLNTWAFRLGIAIAAVGSSLAIAIAIPEINLIFELVGATTGSFVCFICPGMLLL